MKAAIFIIFLILISCSKEENPVKTIEIEDPSPIVVRSFPDTLLQAGHDSNYTFISFRTSHSLNHHLVIEFTGWGIWESGIFLDKVIIDSTRYYKIMGECGTLFTRTYAKVTFVDSLNPIEENSLFSIVMYGKDDTLRLHNIF